VEQPCATIEELRQLKSRTSVKIVGDEILRKAHNPFEIDYSWSGIMGVGASKKPIVKKINHTTAIGIRMGGMGVAIGSTIGSELANLF
jgi:O-succinylbenzoate synthase